MHVNRSILGAEIGFLRRLVRDTPEENSAKGIAGYMHQTYGLGARLTSERLSYRLADYARARRMLAERGIDSPAAPPPPDMPPHPNVGVVEQSQRIACVPLVDGVRTPLAMSYMVVTAKAIHDMNPEILVVVQELEHLEHVHRFQWLQRELAGRTCLAIFHGSRAAFPKPAAGRIIESIPAQIWAVCDLDPVGLAGAAALPRLDALPRPSVEQLRRTGSGVAPQRFVSGMRSHAAYLAGHPKACIREAFLVLNQLDRGHRLIDFPN